MLDKRRWKYLATAGAIGCCLGQVPVAAAALKLTLSADTSRIAVLEALPVTVTVENDGDEAVGFNPVSFSEVPFGALVVVRPNGSSVTIGRPELRLEHGQPKADPQSNLVMLQPGEREDLHLLISCDWEFMRPIFSDQGSYVLSVTYATDQWSVKSNQIRLEVVAPPPGDAEALELLRSMRTPEAIYEPGLTFISRWKKRLPDLERLAAMDESAVYANYARLSLAKRHLMLAEGRPEDDARRAASLTAADEFLDAIAIDGFTLAGEAAAARDTLDSLRRTGQRR